MSVDLQKVAEEAKKAAEEAKIQQAILYLKAIITGLNSLGDNPSEGQIEAIQQAYESLYLLACDTADSFPPLVAEALNELDDDLLSNFVSVDKGTYDDKCLKVFNAEGAKGIILPKEKYTFKLITSVPVGINMDLVDYLGTYKLEDNEIVYMCSKDDGKERLNYRMKSPDGAEHRFSIDRNGMEDDIDTVFKAIQNEGHNEATIAQFKEQKELRRTYLRLIFQLALEHKLKKAIESVDATKNVNVQDNMGQTALHRAAAAGEVDAINTLIARGAEVNVQDNMGQTALHRATAAGEVEAINVLVAKGAKVIAVDNQCRAPLHYAAVAGDVEAINALVAKGAYLEGIDNDSLKPLQYAIMHNKVEAVLTLLEKGANLIDIDINAIDPKGLTLLHYAAKNGQVKAMRTLISAGADVNAKDNQNLTPLQHAAAAGKVPAIVALLGEGAELTDEIDAQGLTLLHRAAVAGEVKLINSLIVAGADVNARDNQNLTPLHHAAAAGNVEAIDALLARSAGINIQGDKNVTALHCAVYQDKIDAAAALILSGADITYKDYKTALGINKGLTEAYKQKLRDKNVSKEDIETDPIVVQMEKLQDEMEQAKKDNKVKPEVLAQTLNAVNKELKNHMDYRFGANKGPFQPAHESGELNDLIQKSKDKTSPYKKVLGYALMGIGVILTAGFLVGLGFVTFGVAPAILTPVIAAIAPVVSFKIAIAVGLTASASIGGSVALNRSAREDARKDAKVLDTAGEAVKIIRTESVNQNISGATDFFKPKKGFFASMLPDVTPIPSK